MHRLHRGYVLTHPHRGVYVGCSAGRTYWSRLDAAGRDVVATFASRASAIVHLDSWEGGYLDPSALAEFDCHPVLVDLPGGWASVAALRVAGLEALIGELAHPAWANPPGRC
jgi:hypothetical protein